MWISSIMRTAPEHCRPRLRKGRSGDIFFSAALQQMDALAEGGYVQESDVTDLLENKVVLIKPVGGETSVTGFSDITNAANLALAGEDVPVGQYARKIFDNLGITDQVMAMEINEGANVTQCWTAVAEHSIEVGIVYSTDAGIHARRCGSDRSGYGRGSGRSRHLPGGTW